MKKRLLSIFTAIIMVCSIVGVMPKMELRVEAAGNLEAAVQWAINKANDNSCGYSQSNRWGPTYYDCSSFVITALKNGGFDVGSAIYTQNMRSNLTTRGFTWITWSSIGGSGNLKRGDILLNDSSDPSKQHTEFYIGNNQNVGAHTSKRAWNDQVSVSGYYNHPWTGVLRYNGTVPDPVLPGTVDTSYATPCTLYADHQFNTYDQWANVESDHYVATGDDCNVQEVYTNGYIKLDYPIPGGRRWAYAKLSDLSVPKVEEFKPALKKWISDTGMGESISTIETNKWLYLCYEIYDKNSSQRINSITDKYYDYSVTEEIYSPDGSLFHSCTYDNSDNNWIAIKPSIAGTYKYVIKVTGKISGTVEKEFEVVNHTHSYGSWTTSKAATCAAEGSKTRKCSICGKTETQTIAKKEHSYYTCHYEPTCIEKGYVEHICSNCGYSYNDSFVNANPNSHDYIQSSVNEIITYTCRDCNYSYTEKYSPINITADKVSGYPGETVTVNVYANLNGNKCYSFVIKNKFDSENFELVSIKSDYLSEYNTYYDNSNDLKNGLKTNLSNGVAFFTNDEAILLNSKKPIITYTFKISENAKQGTYDMQLVSSLSDEYIEFVVEEVDTNYSEFSLVTFKIDPVFLDDAITVKCKHKYTSKVISATCKDKGYTQYTCSVCKHTYKDKYTDVTTEHKWGKWTTSKNATCTSDGSKTRKCSVCSKSEIQTITKLGHDYITEKVNASYKEDGYTKHTCKTCGDSFKDNFVKKPRGDMNNDGNVMIADVVMIQRCLTKTVELSTEQVIAADLNEDGKFNVFDLIIVKRMLINS